MALTPGEIRDALVRRVSDMAGLRESPSTLGPDMEPTSIVDRSFSVLWAEAVPTNERVRSGSTLHPRQTFIVRTAHKPNPKAKADAINVELNDAAGVRNAILTYRSDALQPIHNSFAWKGTSRPNPKIEGVRLVDHTFEMMTDEPIGVATTVPPTVNPAG